MTLLRKELGRIYRHKRIRKRVAGTGEQPRVCVHRSLKNFYAQAIDDTSGKILFGMSTLAKGVRSQLKDNGGNAHAAACLGEVFAAEARKKGITKVCFDRGGYLYHGCVKAFAEAARKGGLEF
ncbi:MAG: 50S ribosomal protein L18 [Candidatus Omnitrophica bacterium]|nr:50S ribosomal protein L18 [Candidatus Omnitrophota bacterium]